MSRSPQPELQRGFRLWANFIPNTQNLILGSANLSLALLMWNITNNRKVLRGPHSPYTTRRHRIMTTFVFPLFINGHHGFFCRFWQSDSSRVRVHQPQRDPRDWGLRHAQRTAQGEENSFCEQRTAQGEKNLILEQQTAQGDYNKWILEQRTAQCEKNSILEQRTAQGEKNLILEQQTAQGEKNK